MSQFPGTYGALKAACEAALSVYKANGNNITPDDMVITRVDDEWHVDGAPASEWMKGAELIRSDGESWEVEIVEYPYEPSTFCDQKF